MKILMLAPEPFFQPRGTPISVYFRIKALANLGHKVDLITYHLGENIDLKNSLIIRIPNLFGVQKVKIGPSFIKIPLDFLLLLKASIQLTKKHYDLIFSHEEAAFLGVMLAKIWRLPHIYDMHSSLPQQLENFNFSRSQILKRIFIWIENFILSNSQSIIVICLDLLTKLKEQGYEARATLLENFIDFKPIDYSDKQIKKKRKEFAPEGEKIVLYTGNFQPYQGIPLLLEAAAKIPDERTIFLLVGGNIVDKEKMEKKAESLNILDNVHFTGEVPHSQIPLLISLADVLVSPRLSGTNTPLKIYSYLKSGKPLVATDLWTHTQILNEKISILVHPDAQSLAKGIAYALSSKEARKRAQAAQEFAEKEYTYLRYIEKTREILQKAGEKSRKN